MRGYTLPGQKGLEDLDVSAGVVLSYFAVSDNSLEGLECMTGIVSDEGWKDSECECRRGIVLLQCQ